MTSHPSQTETSQVLAEVFQALELGLYVWRLDDLEDPSSLRLVQFNRRGAEMSRVGLEGRVGDRLIEIFRDVDPRVLQRMQEVVRTGQALDLGVRPAPGGDHSQWARVLPLSDQMVVTVVVDLKGDERRLRQIKEDSLFLDSIIENLPAMVFVKDATHLRFERFNRAGEELLGLSQEQLLGRNDYDLFPGPQADFFTQKDREVLARGEVLEVAEEPIQTARGERWLHTKKIPIFDAFGTPKHLLGISIDVTERRMAGMALQSDKERLERRVQERTVELSALNDALHRQISDRERAEATLRKRDEELRQAQKMEAVGRLAGGIAHDFNNLLSIVLSYSTMLLEDLAPGDGRVEELKQIKKAGERAADLTRQLLAFSRQQRLAPRDLSLNSIVSGVEKMIRRIIGEDVDLTVRLAPDVPTVLVDGGQLEQVLLNLLVNARDAMPSGGSLTIETVRVVLDEDYARQRPGTVAGVHAMLAVSDTGHGMDAETRARVFEPFFTTKEIGKGTGLGLSTVHGIVEQSGGSIYVYSEVGKGTTFKIYLPQSPGEAREATGDLPPSPPTGGETILLVEDEEQVRLLTRKILKRLGYEVLVAASAEEALKLAAEAQGRIDLLLTDVVMPKIGGRELAGALKQERPLLKVLFMSGYTDDAVVRHGALPEGTAFLQKPLTPQALASKIREVLEGV